MFTNSVFLKRTGLLIALGCALALPLQAQAVSKKYMHHIRNDTALAAKPDPIETIAATAAISTAPESRQFRLPLSRLMNTDELVTLKGPAPELPLTLQMPLLFAPSEVILKLVGASSSALVDSSQMVIKINGRIIQQFALKQERPGFNYAVTIPPDWLRPGPNDVRLVAAQRSNASQNRCDAETAPELWTQIDMRQSELTLSGQYKAVPVRLDAMEALFDRNAFGYREVMPVMTAGAPSDGELKALGIVAQGVGRWYGDAPVSVRHAVLPSDPAALTDIVPAETRGAILVGTFAKLSRYLDGVNLPDRQHAAIAIRPFPGDPKRFLLMMLAPDDSSLSKAATVFNMPSMPWPDQPWMSISAVDLPNSEEVQQLISQPANSLAAFPLRALNYQTTSFTGTNVPQTALRFWDNNWQGRMQIRVHLAYASGASVRSSMNVLVNNILHGSIPLNNKDGGSYFNYAVTVPAGSLKLGWNTLQFQPMLATEDGVGCQPITHDNLAVTLYDDTTVEKYEGTASQQSDLALLSGMGLAYTNENTQQGIAVHLGDTKSEVVSSALTLIAKLAQVHRGPTLPVSLGLGDAAVGQNNIWLASQATLPPKLRLATLAGGLEEAKLTLPMAEYGNAKLVDSAAWMSEIRNALPFDRDSAPKYIRANIDYTTAVANKSMAYTDRKNGVTTIVFTAKTNAALANGIDSIIAPERWTQLRGSQASWTPQTTEVTTRSAEEAPFQAYGIRGGFGMLVSKYPWIVLLGATLVMILLVVLTNAMLHAYRAKKQAGPR